MDASINRHIRKARYRPSRSGGRLS